MKDAALPPAIAAALDAYAQAIFEWGAVESEPRCKAAANARIAVVAAIAAELARLRNGLAIAESFVRTSTAELKEARAVLAECEWSDISDVGDIRCPSCRAVSAHPNPTHRPGCRLAALLQGGR